MSSMHHSHVSKCTVLSILSMGVKLWPALEEKNKREENIDQTPTKEGIADDNIENRISSKMCHNFSPPSFIE